MQHMPEKGLGDSLETIGWVMVALALIMGAVAIATMGRVTTIERAYYGVREVTEWNPGAVTIILASTAWTAMLSFAVMRLGAVLQWLEIANVREELESKQAEQLEAASK